MRVAELDREVVGAVALTGAGLLSWAVALASLPALDPLLAILVMTASAVLTSTVALRLVSGRGQRDRLTGLASRERLHHHLAGAVRGADVRSLWVLVFLDMDRFTLVNQMFGNEVGDKVLTTTASTLRDAAGPRARVARLSGDEFAILARVASNADAALLAEKLQAAIRGQRIAAGSHQLAVTASAGVALIDGNVAAGEVVRRAAAARFAASSRGGDRVSGYLDGTCELDQLGVDATWEWEIRHALTTGMLRLAYQPVIDLREGAISHHEVLVRLQRADGQLLDAHHFMPSIERVGLAPAVDRWVVETAIAFIGQEADAGRQLRLAINLSPRAISDGTIMEVVAAGLAEHGVASTSLEFEITEGSALDDVIQARHFIDRLRRLGCRFSLDDFGTGYSSFAYLRDLPTDAVKIDRRFVTDAAGDRVAEGVVRAVVEMVHLLGRQTIAEGVEDEATLQAMERLGIDLVQGWFLGRPTPAPLGTWTRSDPLSLPEIRGVVVAG